MQEMTFYLGLRLSILFIFLFGSCDFIFRVLWQMWYAVSKSLAEEAAWNFAKENGIDMVVLNPRVGYRAHVAAHTKPKRSCFIEAGQWRVPSSVLIFFQTTRLLICNDSALFLRNYLSKFDHELGLCRRCSHCTYLSI